MTQQEYQNYLKLFKHRMVSQVRFEDIDAFGMVHNAKILFLVEAERTEFLHQLIAPQATGFYLNLFPLVVVQNHIDYMRQLHFGDIYQVMGRVAEIRKSSLVFDNIILDANFNLVARVQTVMVHTDAQRQNSTDIPEEIKQQIIKYKGNFQIQFANEQPQNNQAAAPAPEAPAPKMPEPKPAEKIEPINDEKPEPKQPEKNGKKNRKNR